MVEAPEVTWKLMKEKLRALRKGVDNTDYIDKIRKKIVIQTMNKWRRERRSRSCLRNSKNLYLNSHLSSKIS